VVTRFFRSVYDYGSSSPSRRITVDAIGLVIVAALALLIYRGQVVQSRLVRQGKEAHDYLCYQKVYGIPGRINSSLQYLRDVQTGTRKPVPGITFTDIQNAIERDEATLRALHRIHC
jgi:hypothetical protein